MLLSSWEEICAASRIREAAFFWGARTETTVNQEEKAPKTLRIRIADLLGKAITGIESRFTADDYKPTIADYLKLLQMEIELEQEEIKEIKVTWVEPPATSDSGK